MNILITGGAGFIGSRLAHHLLINTNDNVILVDNMSYGNYDNFIFDKTSILKNKKCKFYEYNAADKRKMNRLFKKYKFDYVYHIAGIAPLPDCQKNKLKCLESNVTSVVNILELSRIYGVKRVVFSSSNSVYEELSYNDFPFKEESMIKTTLFYPTSKHISEEICESFFKTYDMNITIFRFSNVYGSGMDIKRTYPPVTGAFIKCLYNNIQPTIYSTGKQTRDFIYIKDLISLIIKPMYIAKNKFEIVNVSSGESHTIQEQFDIISRLMNKKIKPNYVIESEFWKKMPEIYNGVYKIKNKILINEVNKCTLSSNKKAINEYNWKPRYSFEKGLKETVCEMLNILEDK